MTGRPRELLAQRAVTDRERMEDVPLEDVVQPLALRQHAERPLQGRLRKPAHPAEHSARVE
jgi:hypothetical protein